MKSQELYIHTRDARMRLWGRVAPEYREMKISLLVPSNLSGIDFSSTLATWSKKDSLRGEWTARPASVICLVVLISSTLKSPPSISIPPPSPPSLPNPR